MIKLTARPMLHHVQASTAVVDGKKLDGKVAVVTASTDGQVKSKVICKNYCANKILSH